MDLTAIIIDDESPSRNELKYLLKKIGGILVIDEANNFKDGLNKIKKHKPDVIFLDIQLGSNNGITLAKKVLEMNTPPLIIFSTAYDKYALEAFEINALDYILKPFSEERIKTTLKRVEKNMRKRQDEDDKEEITTLLKDFIEKKSYHKISVWKHDRIVLLDPAEIIYIVTREGKKTVFKTKEGEYEGNYALGEIEQRLEEYNFFRPHRSYLINLNFIKEIEPWFHNTYQLIMKHYEEEKIPVARNRIKQFKEVLKL